MLTVCFGAPSTQAQQTGIVVNGRPLTLEEGLAYGADVPPGNYWYDAKSGLWGVEGGPTAGQIAPGLPLGGPLQPDASNGDTDVFINGREIHVQEFLELQQIFGAVPPGRYWLGADGFGGAEGGPATFDLRAAAQPEPSDDRERPFEDEYGDFCARYGAQFGGC